MSNGDVARGAVPAMNDRAPLLPAASGLQPSHGQLPSEVYYQAFTRHYIEAQYLWVQFATEWLADCSRAFNGDLQLMLILSVIGQVQLADFATAGGVADNMQSRAISASRISDVTGIPRETVRRKLKLLHDKGWIDRRGESHWCIRVENGNAPVRQALGQLEDNAIRKICRFVAAFEPLSRR